MKRFYALLAAAVLFLPVWAGGIVTNTNHSAMFTRMQCRDATTEIDAVYYNPAGLTKISNGLHISLNNQSIWQTRNISSTYSFLNPSPKDYEAKITAPLFPAVYAAFKFGKFAISAGFNPIGGGGSADYEKGLPSFEYGPSELVPSLADKGQPVTDYSLGATFEGSSVFYGYQANLSYAINDMISVAVGGRYVTAKETYKGAISDISINYAGALMRADDFFNNTATTYSDIAAGAPTMATGLQTAIGAGMIGGDDPLADATIIGALTATGQYSTGMTNNEAITSLGSTPVIAGAGAAQASLTASMLGDQDLDMERSASGITPIVSVNISPIDILDISVKYEFKTELEFTNETKSDVRVGYDPGTSQYITMFPDGDKEILDIPAMLSVGVSAHPGPLTVNGGVHYYFDKDANWAKDELTDELLIDRGLLEMALGAQFNMGFMAVSAGWLMTSTGVQEDYQTDLSYSLSTNTIGGGLEFHLSPLVDLNLGASYTIYKDGEKNMERTIATAIAQAGPHSFIETYDKNVFIVAIGANFHIATGD